MLVGSDGRPDTSKPTPGEFEKRFLQKLAGEDVREAEYVEGYPTPLDIPTLNINKNAYYIPADKLNSALEGFVSNLVLNEFDLTNRRRLSESSVIEAEFSQGKAILSTDLDHLLNNRFSFDVNDKMSQDISPPAAIKIEKLPSNGKIFIT
jgi:hypothetical protein